MLRDTPGETLDTKGCYELTGLKISCEETACPLQVKITDEGSKSLPGVDNGTMYGTQTSIGPLFYGDDPSADVLGLLYGHGTQGLITKKINGVQVYYSAAPYICASVIRGIAYRSGVHIYNNKDDVLYANKSFIALHTAEGGERHLTFPQKTSLYDVYRDKEIARDTYSVDVTLPARETFLYFMGTEKEWREK